MFQKPKVKEIHPDKLQEWLKESKPVTIIDVRHQQDYEAWHIAEATSVDAYAALSFRSPGILEDFKPETGQPVVAVCYSGQTSKVAATYLQSKGIEAYSLIGGMQWWSNAWNQAEISLNQSSAKVFQIRRTGKGCLSYLIGSGSSAIVIDASINPQSYIDLATENGWTIETVLETHIHADHLTRGRTLAQETGARYLLPKTDRTHFEHESISDGEQIEFGTSQLKAIHTPGHTFETTTYLLDDEILFSSDTLFPTSIGRADLKTTETDLVERAQAMYHSLQRLKGLNPDLLLAACHTSQSVAFNSPALASTLGAVLVANETLISKTIDDFTETMIGKVPPTPPNHLQIIALNEQGTTPRGDLTSLEAGGNNCAM